MLCPCNEGFPKKHQKFCQNKKYKFFSFRFLLFILFGEEKGCQSCLIHFVYTHLCSSQITPHFKNVINLKRKEIFVLFCFVSVVGTFCATCKATGYPFSFLNSIKLAILLKLVIFQATSHLLNLVHH